MRRLVASISLCLLLVGALAGCGGKPQPTGPLPTKVIDITVQGSTVSPNGDRIDVGVGQRIELDVTADAPGEIHVHSSPEQEFTYDKGSTTLQLKAFQAPGVITVESHTLNKVLFSLKVS